MNGNPVRVARRQAYNLPAELSSFVGRRHEVAQAKRLLTQGRWLTLTGAGGVGKTRLALRVAAQARRASRDGIWRFDVAAVSDVPVARAVAEAFGLSDQCAESAEALASAMVDKQVLLVLDTCDRRSEDCAQLAGALLAACPGLRIVATSRQALGVQGERVLVVPGLSLPDTNQDPLKNGLAPSEAISLFAERGAAAEFGFEVNSDNYASVAAICRRLDGNPMMIELAALRLRELSVEQILARLDDPFRLLSRGFVAAPRHSNLRALTDWSFDLCTHEEQRVWARLSVFPGAFDAAVAEDVCAEGDLAREDVRDAVAGLVAKSVVVGKRYGKRVRYQLPETMRRYGWERLVESGENAVLTQRYSDRRRCAISLVERLEAATDWVSTRDRTTLTRRERQVAELVAQGLSNKQIAAKLVISQRTVDCHVEHMLRKLGFTSRRQVASWSLAQRCTAEDSFAVA